MYIFLGFILILLVLFLFYLTVLSFRKLDFFKKTPNPKAWLLACIPLVILFIFFNTVNSIVIVFYYVLSLVIVSLIMKLIKKKNGYVLVISSIIITAVYLGIGAYINYHIVETKYDITTTKDVKNFKIIQISDTHIGASFSGKEFQKYIDGIKDIDADLVVITGDFVDDSTSKKDMVDACKAFKVLEPMYGIYFVNGNHDKGYSKREFTYAELTKNLEKNNVILLDDQFVDINENIALVGREDKQYSRMEIEELVQNIDKSKYIIDLNHQPNDYKNEKNVVDLVLSGHTHGGQLFPFRYFGKILGANDAIYGLHKKGNTNFIVSSGMSGWAIDFKVGAKSEYVVITINGE